MMQPTHKALSVLCMMSEEPTPSERAGRADKVGRRTGLPGNVGCRRAFICGSAGSPGTLSSRAPEVSQAFGLMYHLETSWKCGYFQQVSFSYSFVSFISQLLLTSGSPAWSSLPP